MLSYLWDLVGLVGAVCLIVGTAQIYPPAAWLVAGIACLVVGVLGSRPIRRNTEER